MTVRFFTALESLRGPRKGGRPDLLQWAKTEYGNDWQWAYQQMLDNGGNRPKFDKGGRK
jgi:hypothetical protein